MTDERKADGTDPIEAARKGLGLLFQAARLTLDRIPTQKIEEAVVSGAREVGRVIESVTSSLDESRKKHDEHAPAGATTAASVARASETQPPMPSPAPESPPQPPAEPGAPGEDRPASPGPVTSSP